VTTLGYRLRSSAFVPDPVRVVADGSVERRRCMVVGSLGAVPDALGAVVASDQTDAGAVDVRGRDVIVDDCLSV
jgi:hypothetical protein